MCGIIGVISHKEITNTLLEGLKRLEYRGYDSAGLVVIDNTHHLTRLRTQGKVQVLKDAMGKTNIKGNIGIAHTRWATHGKPCEENAHPHVSNDEIAVVHNGIIENHDQLREKLIKLGYKFSSETDTEVAAHLIHLYYKEHKELLTAVWQAAKEMHGAFALGVIHKSNTEELIGVRRGSPLVVGVGDDENFLASDSLALLSFANSVIFLDDGDSVRLTTSNIEVFDADNKLVKRNSEPLTDNALVASKGSYRHFMLKEILEQDKVLEGLLEGRITSLEILKASFGVELTQVFPKIKNIHIVACGTSYHAGLIAKYWFESLVGVPVQVEIASEYRYRDVVVPEGSLFITISQSGETADTIAALNKAKSLNYLIFFSICNIGTSTLVRETDFAFLTKAGVEIGVASTKAFTTQLAAFLMLAAVMCRDTRGNEVIKDLQQLVACSTKTLEMNQEIEKLAAFFVNKEHTLFLGRGVQYPVALEGALKLKEISYIHAEAYPAGELKHGPLALVDENMPVIAVAPNDELLDKLKSNLHEVSARGGQLFVFVDDSQDWSSNGTKLIKVPSCGSWIAPIIYTIPLQLLAYHVAALKGTDVDQPRNLAKSVTVE